MVRQAVRQAHGPEQRRMTHHPEPSRRGIQKGVVFCGFSAAGGLVRYDGVGALTTNEFFTTLPVIRPVICDCFRH